MKETYAVKLPKKIVFGDPLYFEEFKGKKLDSLVVNFHPPRHFEARVVLQEVPFDEFPDAMDRTMTIFLAPAKTMGVYLKDMLFETQDEMIKEIGVDTAQYYLKVDENEETIHTGGDGYWGSYMELSRTINGHRILDAAIISISMPENETFDSMRERLNYFFKDVTLTENACEIKNTDSPEEGQDLNSSFSMTQQ